MPKITGQSSMPGSKAATGEVMPMSTPNSSAGARSRGIVISPYRNARTTTLLEPAFAQQGSVQVSPADELWESASS